MNSHFLLTNNNASDIASTYTGNSFVLSGFNSNKSNIFIKGYVLPRFDDKINYIDKQGHDLVVHLIEKFPDSWMDKVKGRFVILVMNQNEFTVVTDHLGLYPIYLKDTDNGFTLSDSFWALNPEKSDFNEKALKSKALFHREVGTITIAKSIQKIEGGSIVSYKNGKLTIKKYWKPSHLLKPLNKKLKIPFFTNLIKQQVKQVSDLFKPTDYSITLTGGKDSRTALAAMLNQGIKPIGFTYGNQNSKDAAYAKMLASKANIEHQIFTPPSEESWINEMYSNLLDQEHPWINVHRAHRLFAFQKVSKQLTLNTAYFAGYLGGELLMGIYYDDLIFSSFLTRTWENQVLKPEKILEHHFIKSTKKDDLKFDLETLNKDKSSFYKQFQGLFEIGVPHHAQDLTLSGNFFDYPIAFFLDIDFLSYLFQSKYSFEFADNKTKNPFQRYKLFKFNLNIQHTLASELDDVPFAKKGTYSTKEFKRGAIYWSFVKIIRYFTDRKKFPSSYSYNDKYRGFVLGELQKIKRDDKHPIHSYYDLDKAIKHLESHEDLRQEKHWHRFTNIIMTYNQLNKFV